MLAIWNDPAFLQFVGDRGARTLDEAQVSLRAGPLSLYSEYGYGPFGVERREDGARMGICGLFRRDGLDEPDLGFALLPEFCRHGYGYEAAAAVLIHANVELGLPRVVAVVSPGNGASIALLEKLGFRFSRPIRLPGDSDEISLFSIEFEE